MYDAIALLAISQLVCLGGLAYLFVQFQKGQRSPGHERRGSAHAPRAASTSSVPLEDRRARRPAAAQPRSSDAVAAELAGLDLDIPALAARMNRSEEEVRLLLRRQGAAR